MSGTWTRRHCRSLLLEAETLGDTSVGTTVETYLLARGQSLMSDCIYGSNMELSIVATLSDRLGWDSFIEGRVSTHWLTLVAQLLWRKSSVLLPTSWVQTFISKLHNIVHKQWIYHNSVIHYKLRDRWTLPEQHAILSKFEEYALIDPDTILPRHWFLFDMDGSGPTLQHLFLAGRSGHCSRHLYSISQGIAYTGRFGLFLS